MTRIARLQTHHFQGLDIDEAVPPRLLLSGPNGSGKSARLRAIAFALLGPPGKDGLAPFTADELAAVAISTDEGLTVKRATKIRSRAPLSVQNSGSCDPSQGEKTADAVQIRVDREIAPNVLALDLDAFFGLSGRERRRTLLAALGAGGGTAAEMQATLDSELGSNAAWPRIRAAVRPIGEAQEYLVALEGAAKAQASEYRAQKATAESLAKAPPVEARGNVEDLRAALEEANAAVRTLSDHAAAAARGASDRARLQRESAALYGGLPAALHAIESGEARLKAAQTALDVWGDLRRKKAAEAAEAAAAAKPLDAKERTAKSAVARAEGRIAALEDLFGQSDVDDPDCPVCGKSGFTPDAFKARIEKDRHGLKGLQGKWQAALAASRAAQKALEESNYAEAEARLSGESATKTRDACKRLLEVEAALAAGDAAATAASDPGALRAAEDAQRAAREALEAATRAEGARSERQRAESNASRADELRRAAEAVQALVGPSGKQGDSLGAFIGELEAKMAASWARAGTLRFRLADARGEPDAALVLERAGATIPLASLSGGERATALAALVAGLASMRSDRTTVALIEAGEVDETALLGLLSRLGKEKSIATAVVATHLGMSERVANEVALAGFELRRIS